MNSISSSAPDIAINVAGLSKSFGGREVVHDLSMQVKVRTAPARPPPSGCCAAC
jgi:ABC-2 type transport system ATP-binding protein